MPKTQDDREPIGRATDDEVSNSADLEFENDDFEDEDNDVDENMDTEDVR